MASEGRISGAAGRFEVSGELGFETVSALLEQSRSTLFAEPAARIELDLGGVSRADSAGLALLLQWMRMARELNCEIRFQRLPQQLLAIARPAELEPLLPVGD